MALVVVVLLVAGERILPDERESREWQLEQVRACTAELERLARTRPPSPEGPEADAWREELDAVVRRLRDTSEAIVEGPYRLDRRNVALVDEMVRAMDLLEDLFEDRFPDGEWDALRLQAEMEAMQRDGR